jgi:hypothetical protein
VVWMVSQCQLDTMVSLPRWRNMIMEIMLVMNASLTEVWCIQDSFCFCKSLLGILGWGI